METIKMISDEYFKSLKIIHIALVIGVVFFCTNFSFSAKYRI